MCCSSWSSTILRLGWRPQTSFQLSAAPSITLMESLHHHTGTALLGWRYTRQVTQREALCRDLPPKERCLQV